MIYYLLDSSHLKTCFYLQVGEHSFHGTYFLPKVVRILGERKGKVGGQPGMKNFARVITTPVYDVKMVEQRLGGAQWTAKQNEKAASLQRMHL
ncbi:hypothetical protein AVEN_166028-1 [Araneus ventricosus]|uniref:Uncharacterized protein n=1 Tax=Araneus ventricosus TaxID=182803 RepID=A0A4Y2MVR4_ARAVE|nr:hypothetical protein AVEN_166028-1 [Araneus ventricosus]